MSSAGSAYAVIDGTDGRTHHVRLLDLDATSDGAPGSIVELRRFQDSRGRERTAIAVRSDLPLAAQVESTGATWLDRQLLAREPGALGPGGFGLEVQQAMNARAEHLIRENLARHDGAAHHLRPQLAGHASAAGARSGSRPRGRGFTACPIIPLLTATLSPVSIASVSTSRPAVLP